MSYVAVGIAGGSALLKGVTGIIQNNKANKLAAANKRPDYVIPQEFQDNLAMAQQMAQVGLPQQQYNNALNGISRNQAGVLAAISRSANPIGVASVVRATNDATNNLNVADANARQNNQRLLLQQRGIMGNQQLAKQDWDKFSRYRENAQAAQALKGSGLQNIYGAVNDASSIGLMSLMNGSFGSGKAAPVGQLSPVVQNGGVAPSAVTNFSSVGGYPVDWNNYQNPFIFRKR